MPYVVAERGCCVSNDVTAEDRAQLAEDINDAILRIIDKAGFRNRHAVDAAYSAAKMVVNKVVERKKVGA